MLVCAWLPIVNAAQREQAPPPAPSARAMAPIDLTGYWVSVVTEDWRYRMITPKRGDYASVPLNTEARRVADAWDPVKDEAGGDACKSYGIGNIMRVPGRVHITWQDDKTLKLETDAGTQTRLLRFGDGAGAGDDAPPAPGGDFGWQGYSVARWEFAGPQRRGGMPGGAGPPGGGARAPGGGAGPPGDGAALRGDGPGGRGRGGPLPRGGSLKVVTTHMKAGYLRKNGVPYSERAAVTEYIDRHTEANGDQWFTVTTIVDDPKYLTEPFITSTHFKKEPDGAKWRPSPCTAS
jgi:hypothetical protein